MAAVQGVTFEILPGLPGTGSYPEQFPCKSHREGLVVKFTLPAGERWVGNFQGFGFNQVLMHPNGVHVIVIAGGNGYIIDPLKRKLIEEFGFCISAAVGDEASELCIFYDCLHFFALGRKGLVWESPRVFLDEVRNVRVVDGWVIGEAWDIDDSWVPFRVSLAAGEVEFLSPGTLLPMQR